MCWIIVALGAITGDGRSPRRVAAAAITAMWFLSSMPIWGKEVLLGLPEVPILVDRVVEDAFTLAALAVIAIIATIRPTGADTGLLPPDPDPAGEGSAPVEPVMVAASSDA
jgi:hypothetical protein